MSEPIYRCRVCGLHIVPTLVWRGVGEARMEAEPWPGEPHAHVPDVPPGFSLAFLINPEKGIPAGKPSPVIIDDTEFDL